MFSLPYTLGNLEIVPIFVRLRIFRCAFFLVLASHSCCPATQLVTAKSRIDNLIDTYQVMDIEKAKMFVKLHGQLLIIYIINRYLLVIRHLCVMQHQLHNAISLALCNIISAYHKCQNISNLKDLPTHFPCKN